MRKSMFLAAAVLGLAAPAIAADPIAKASGQGQLYDGRTFAFTAEIFADGSADGMAVIKNSAFTGDSGKGPYRAKLEIKCARRDGNRLTFGAMTSRTNDSNLNDAAFFTVEDKGEPGKDNDRMSFLYFWDDIPGTTGDPQACPASEPFETHPIESGNIQVKFLADPLAFKTPQ